MLKKTELVPVPIDWDLFGRKRAWAVVQEALLFKPDIEGRLWYLRMHIEAFSRLRGYDGAVEELTITYRDWSFNV